MREEGETLASKQATGPSCCCCRRRPWVGRSVGRSPASPCRGASGLGSPSPKFAPPQSLSLVEAAISVSPPPAITTELATALAAPRSEPLVEALCGAVERRSAPLGRRGGGRDGLILVLITTARTRVLSFLFSSACPAAFPRRQRADSNGGGGGPARCMHHGLAAFHALGEGPAWNAGLAAAPRRGGNVGLRRKKNAAVADGTRGESWEQWAWSVVAHARDFPP